MYLAKPGDGGKRSVIGGQKGSYDFTFTQEGWGGSGKSRKIARCRQTALLGEEKPPCSPEEKRDLTGPSSVWPRKRRHNTGQLVEDGERKKKKNPQLSRSE